MLIALCGGIFIILLYIYLIYPSPIKNNDFERFSHRSYAHRGLYDNTYGPPENTLLAFLAAAEYGYGIELDLQMTNDKKVVIFHDDDLIRAAGIDKRIADMNYDEIKDIELFGSKESIPVFSDFLALIAGKVPLIVELKSDPKRTDELCNAVYSELKNYKGDFCIESFDPFITRWFLVNAPKVVRGQLSMGRKRYKEALTPLQAFIASSLFVNAIGRPNFIAYQYSDRSFGFRISKLMGAMTVMWTVNDRQNQEIFQKTEDAIIFEGFFPEVRW